MIKDGRLENRIFNNDLPKNLDYPTVPVGSILKGSAQRFATKDAYIYRDGSITYGELYQDALRFANSLRDMGVGKGIVVSTHLPTCIQSVKAYHGIILTGATFSPINPYFPHDDVLYQLNDSDTEIVITHESVAKLIQGVFAETKLKKVIVTGDQENFSNKDPIDTSSYSEDWYSFASLIASGKEQEINAEIDPHNDLVHIAYTGGTTGRPKGVMITHANLISSCVQTSAWGYGCLPEVKEDGAFVIKPVEKDKTKYLSKYPNFPGEGMELSPSPLFHISGVFGSMIYPILLGNTKILLDRFNPENFLKDIEKYQVTHIFGAPAMWNALFNHPDINKRNVSSVRSVGSGGAPLSDHEMNSFMKAFPNANVSEGYGLTEATSSLTNSVSFRSGLRKLGTVGHPFYDTEVKLIALDGESDDPLPVGEIGEICSRGPQIMKGYYKKPEETAEALQNGWLRTGDIGMFDEDGLLSIVDRKTDMLIYNGFNVYPNRLEGLLFDHPAVANAVVIGKPMPAVGEIPKAFVILKNSKKVTEEELMKYVNNQVVHYSKIRELEFVGELPATAAGKVSKKTLRDMEIKKTDTTVGH